MTSTRKDSNNSLSIVAPYYSSNSHKQDILQVLIIDDSVTVQKAMTIWLEKKKCQVTTALNGAIALDLLKTNAYDLVFLDFLMPVMDGLTCLHAFHDWLLHSPPEVLPQGVVDQWIIGLSATALKTDWQDAFAAGLDMFCSKPVDMQALGYIIEAKKLGISMKKLLELDGDNHVCLYPTGDINPVSNFASGDDSFVINALKQLVPSWRLVVLLKVKAKGHHWPEAFPKDDT
eukprot:gene9430-10415_t